MTNPFTSTTGLLARRYLRKGRTQLTVIMLLAAVTGALLNLGALCAFAYPRMVQEQADRLNAPQIQVLTPQDRAAEAERLLAAEPAVSEVETTGVLSENSTIDFGETTVDAIVVYVDLDHPSDIGRSEVLTRDDDAVATPAYLPYIFSVSGGYEIGDEFTVTTTSGETRTFRVAGFMKNLFLGFITMGVIGVGLPADEYAALTDTATPPNRTSLVQAQIPDPDAIAKTSGHLAESLNSTGWTDSPTWSWDWQTLNVVVQTGPQIYAVSLVFFTLIVVIVVLMVTWFWIRSTIAHDLRALGLLATVGTRARQIGLAFALPPALAVLCGSALGVLLSYAAVPVVATSLAGQTGLPWRPAPDPVAGLVTVAAVTLVVAGLSWLAARRIHRLQPVEALSGGHKARSFRRNWLPLASTPGGLHALLGIKQGIGHRAQSLMVFGVMLVVGFGAMGAATLFTNAMSDRTGFIRTLVGDLGDIAVQADPEADRAALLAEVRATPGVADANYKDYLQGAAAGIQGVTIIMDDFADQHWSSISKGREPKHANEVAIGALMSQRSGVGIGEEISVRVGDRTRDYVVVGTLSTVQYGGMRINMTTEGYRRVAPDFVQTQIDINTTTDASVTEVIDRLKARVGDQLTSVSNQRQSVDSQLAVYLVMMKVLAWGILAVTTLVAGLVVGLMVNTVLTAERASFGLRKAVGFSSGQLMRQLVIAYLPSAVIGTLAGCALGLSGMPALLGTSLESTGVTDPSLALSPVLAAAIAAALVLIATVTAGLGAAPLMRRDALGLMAEE